MDHIPSQSTAIAQSVQRTSTKGRRASALRISLLAADLVQFAGGLFAKLSADLAQGNHGEDGDGDEGAQNKEPQDPTGQLAVEQCSFQFHFVWASEL
jgi:hypothetical protein